MLNFLDIQNPWGKVMERKGLRFKKKKLAQKWSKIAAVKNNLFKDFFHLLTLFKCLFSKLFRFSESFGESNRKKLSQI